VIDPDAELDLLHQRASLAFNPAWGPAIHEEAAAQFQQAVQDGMDIHKTIDERNAAAGRAQAWNAVLSWGPQWRDAHTALIAEQNATEAQDTGPTADEQWHQFDVDAPVKP